MDFSKLRQTRGTNFDSLQKSLEKSAGGNKFQKDERIWKYKEKDGKSQNIIRFLPIPAKDFQLVEDGKFKPEDLTPMIKVVRHQFQGPNGWFVENSLQTFGLPCPVREHDGPLWGEAKKANDKPAQDVLKTRLPKQDIYVGIQVIKDGTNPENNGKEFLFLLPATLATMIEKANKPEFDGEVPFDPFDPWEGADLLLNLTFEERKIGTKDVRVPKWENVKWARTGPMAGGDEKEMERIWKASHSLLEFHDPAKFKTYDQLREKFCKVMNLDKDYNPIKPGAAGSSASDYVKNKADAPAAAPAASAPSAAPAAQNSAAATPVAAPPPPPAADDGLDEFERLLAQSGG